MSDNFDSNAVMKDDGFKEPPTAPKKAETTPPSTQGGGDERKAVPKVSLNTYVVRRGDHPWIVGERLYGDGNKGREIVLRNPGSEWKPGDVLDLL